MHTEGELRQLAKTLLESYGKASTSEMISLMRKHISFDLVYKKPPNSITDGYCDARGMNI